MAAIENIEWLNANALRTYPIHEDSDVVPRTTTGARAVGVRIPTCLVVDLSFTLAQDDISEDIRLCLTGLVHAEGVFSFELSARTGDTAVVVATRAVRIAGHAVNDSYKLQGVGEYADCTGWITLGDLARADEEMPDGTFRFEPGQCDFELSTLRMAPRGVRSIAAVGKYDMVAYAPLYGHVRLVGGTDVTVSSDAPNNAIWIKAQSGTGYEGSLPCGCDAGGPSNVVETINGMAVRSVQIVGDQCIHVSNDLPNSKVMISNECGTACCGCTELQYVDAAIATLNESIAQLSAFADALGSRLDELSSTGAVTIAAFDAYPTVRP